MEEKLKYKIRTVVEKLGLEQSLDMFGEDIIKQVYIDNPSLFLNQFNNLKLVEQDGEILYVDNDNLTLFCYDKEDRYPKYGYYWVNESRIWAFFSEVMCYTYTEIEGIMKEWLGTTYNLRERRPNKLFL